MTDKLRVEAHGTTTAAPEVVWHLVANASSYAEWGAWSASGDRHLDGKFSGDVGTTRWMRYRNTTTVEQVLEAEPGRRMVYTVVSGIPVANYRAQISLTPSAEGTEISWEAEWDRTLLGRFVARKLRAFYPQMMTLLVDAANRAAAVSSDSAVIDMTSAEPVGAER